MKPKEIKCLDPVMKYCQECPYGIIEYDSNIETYADTIGACFKTSCIHGLEDTEPTKKLLKGKIDYRDNSLQNELLGSHQKPRHNEK